METKKEYDYLFKILTVGQRGSGSTSIIVRLGRNEFSPGYIPTIGTV